MRLSYVFFLVAVFLIIQVYRANVDVYEKQVSKNAAAAQFEAQKRYDETDNRLKNMTGITPLRINPTENYNYKTKEEIYEIRKQYVKTSLFATADYSPSSAVFGQIEDKKPWYGLKYQNCIHSVLGTQAATYGNSEESRFVNNPDNLVGILNGGYIPKGDYRNKPFCTDSKLWLIPKKSEYNAETNTIETTYFYPLDHSGFTMTGINARDFGYNFAHADKYSNIEFTNSKNISNSISRFADFIHTGGSCKIEGGCNNDSPHQPELDFSFGGKHTARIHLKLWREQPQSPLDEADINYEIVIRPQ